MEHQEYNEILEEEFEYYPDETLRKCAEEGIPCSYGICDECPLMTNEF